MSLRDSPALTALIYAAVGVVWIVGTDALLALVTLDPVVQERLQLAKGIAFVAGSAAVLFLLLRAAQARALPQPELPAADALPAGWRSGRMLTLLALTVPLSSIVVFSLYAGHNEREVQSDLRIIADAKARQIENWLAERRGDAATLMNSRGFIERIMALQADPASRHAELVRDRLAAMQAEFKYASIVLLDPHGRLLLAVGEPESLAPAAGSALVREVASAGKVLLTDLHPAPRGGAHLHLAAPLTDGAAGPLVAVLVMELDPETFLFPLVREWPVATHSGEAFLVRREGDTVVNLSRLRERAQSGQTYRWPLTDARFPAVTAVLTGAAGAMRGVDYRGVRVLAAWRPVAGTDWHLVAKIDRVEALAAARAIALWVTAVTTVAAVLIACVLLLLARQQRRAQQLALRLQADQLFKQFYELPFIGMAVTSAASRRWVNFNDHLCTLLGYTRDELLERSWLDLTHPDDRAHDAAQFERLSSGDAESFAGEKRYLRKDGSVLYAQVDVKCVRKPDGALDKFVVTIEDISERKAAEAKILTLNRLYRTLSECNSAIVHCRDEHELFAEICRAAVESGSMKMAWIGLTDEASGMLRVVAAYGEGQAYLQDVAISVDAAHPRGHGPTGTAVRSGTPVWCQDFMRDPSTALWHDSAAQFGWGASAALPLRRDGRSVGALTLYAALPGGFDEDVQTLLLEIAQDVSFGLDNFAREAARQQGEAHLRESEDRYRALFDNSQDAIMLAVPGGRILAANAAACHIFRCEADDLIGRARDELVDPDDPRLATALAQLADSGTFSGELTLRRRDGERFPAEVSTSLFRERSGELRTSVIVHDLTARKRAEDRLAHLAQHDLLTGLPNRLLLTDRLSVALARARRDATRLLVLCMNLDRFKNVNEVFGHELGDHILQEIAARLTSSVRAADTVSRHGGDEFILVLPDIDDEQDAARMARKLIATIAEPLVLGGSEVVLTVSIGIAMHPDNGDDAETLLRNAGAAMHAAKQGGRNNYGFYSADMNAFAHERLALENDLRRAIEREQLFVVYQPQLALASGEVVGIEALVRWRHPTRGVVPPAQFIPIAEDCGLIDAIGKWVLESACRQHAAWLAGGRCRGSVAVNVSVHQFRQADFVDTVAALLARTGLPGAHLELELTESVVMRGVDEVLRKLKLLAGLGIKLAIDDFGTGYSSLSYLQQFPIHRLKIDKSFTHGLPHDRESAAIAEAIISMGHSLGLNVLAEGVETTAQQDHLCELGCDVGQGYLYAQPLDADSCSDYLAAHAAGAASVPRAAAE